MSVRNSRMRKATLNTRYGRWVVVTNHFVRVDKSRRPRSYVIVKCVCGLTKRVRVDSLIYGESLSCKRCADSHTRWANTLCNGYTRRKLVRCIAGAIYRCTDPTFRQWKDYGGRGIRVYKPWVNDRQRFLRHLLTLPGHDDPEKTLDRIDNNSGYKPGNLRFATRQQQADNRRPKCGYTRRITSG